MTLHQREHTTQTRHIQFRWKKARRIRCFLVGARGQTWHSHQRSLAMGFILTQTTTFNGRLFRRAKALAPQQAVTRTVASASTTTPTSASRPFTAKTSSLYAQMPTVLHLMTSAQHLLYQKVEVGRSSCVRQDDRLTFCANWASKCTSSQAEGNYRSCL